MNSCAMADDEGTCRPPRRRHHVESSGVTKSRWCPTCGAEYLPQMTKCSDCGAALVDELPPEPNHEIAQTDAPPFEFPPEPDLFILPDGRRVKELPLGPEIPTDRPENPIDWIE